MSNDPFSSSAPERVTENRQGIAELRNRISVLERAAAFHNPCQGVRAKQDVDMMRDHIKNYEYAVYAMTVAAVLVVALLAVGLVWVVTRVDERVDQIEERIKDDERRKDGPMTTMEEQDLEEQRQLMQQYVNALAGRVLPNGVEVRMATQKEQREALEAAATPSQDQVAVTADMDAEIWDEPDVELEPVPGTGGRVNRTIQHTNLPGGFLMDTRSFEKWVLESFIPLQDRTAAALEKCDRALKSLNVALSRLGRIEQQVRELKKIGRE